jgi:hypothetical protein
MVGDQILQKWWVSVGDQLFGLNGGCQWVTKICRLAEKGLNHEVVKAEE